jgi:hypothetical protein
LTLKLSEQRALKRRKSLARETKKFIAAAPVQLPAHEVYLQCKAEWLYCERRKNICLQHEWLHGPEIALLIQDSDESR